MKDRRQQANHNLYYELIENAYDLVQSVDAEGNIIYINKRWKELLGYSEDEIRSLKFFDIIHPDYVSKCLKIFKEVLKGTSFENVGTIFISKSGTEIVVEGSIRPYFEEDKFIATSGIFREVTERKNSEKYIERLIESIDDGILTFDREFRYTTWNSTMERITGKKKEEVLGKCATDIFPFLKETGEDKLFRGAIEGKEQVGSENVYTIPETGRDGFFEARYYPLRDENGEVTGGLSIVRDITERKKIELELRESEEKYKTLLDSADDFIYLIDCDYTILSVNLAAANIIGMKPEEAIGKKIFDIFPKEIADEYAKNLKNVFETGKKFSSESKLVVGKGDGKELNEFWISAALYPVKDVQGNIISVLGISRDLSERKRFEQRLQEERDRAQKYLDIAGVILVALDVDGNVSLINRMGCKILGYEEEEIIGKNWFDNFIPEDERGAVKSVFNQLMKGEIERFEFCENPVINRNGEIRIVEWRNTVLNDKSGKITGILGSGNDITRRRNAEILLKESKERYEKLFNNSNDAIIIHDFNGKIAEANIKACEKLDISCDVLLGMNIQDIFIEEDFEESNGTFLEHIFAESAYRFESKIKSPTGNLIYMDVSSKVIDGDKGVIQSILRDITRYKEALLALKDSEEKFKAITTSAKDAIILIDNDGKVSYWNNAAEEILGYSKEEILGKDLHKTVLPKKLHQSFKWGFLHFKYRGTGPVIGKTLELTAVKKDGSHVPIELSLNSVKLGGKWNAVGIVRDITERKLMEKAQKDLNDLLKLINKILRHDILNDMAAASTSIELFEEIRDEKSLKTALKSIENSVNLIRDMKELETFIEADKKLVPFDIKEITENIKEKYDVDVVVKNTDSSTVFADKALQSIIDNIFRNAVVHGQASLIEVEISGDKNWCTIRIADNGTGIPDKIKDKIFDEGYKYGKTGHTGLGLFIVKKTVERYGGEIWVEDNQPHGAVFIMKLKTAFRQEEVQ